MEFAMTLRIRKEKRDHYPIITEVLGLAFGRKNEGIWWNV